MKAFTKEHRKTFKEAILKIKKGSLKKEDIIEPFIPQELE
jgi:hypothetical protein